MPTIGQEAAAILFSTDTLAMVKKRGSRLTQDEVAAIIDRCAKNNPQPAKAKVDGADYGDRKKIPPTPEQVTAYSAAIGYPMDGQAWCDAYEVKGWKVGDHRMKDWQAAVRNWKANRYGQDGIALKDGGAGEAGRDYSKL